MRTVEFLVYFTAAVLVGVMSLVLLSIFDPTLSDKYLGPLLPQREFPFRTLPFNPAIGEIIEFWQEHRHDPVPAEHTFVLEGAGYFNKRRFFAYIKDQNFCDMLQSAFYECGRREDTFVGTFSLPSVVTLRVENGTLYINPNATQMPPLYYNNAFVTFGGFESQGVLQKSVPAVPQGVEILSMTLTLNVGTDFEIFINANKCGQEYINLEFLNTYDLTKCAPLLKLGMPNNLSLAFQRASNTIQYVGGGFLRIEYATSRPHVRPATQTGRLELPGISGQNINYYGSFYVPGTLTGLSGRLHYDIQQNTPLGFEFTVNGQPIIEDNATTSRADHALPDSAFRSRLNYADLSQSNVLVRLGSAPNTTIEATTREQVDVVMVTDVSGSMDGSIRGVVQGCASGSKLQVAKCVDSKFVDIILSNPDGTSGNRLGLVSFAGSVEEWHSLTRDPIPLKNQIAGYATCVSCGIRGAQNILDRESTDPNIVKAILVMTDGRANTCYGGGGCQPGPDNSPGPAGEMIQFARIAASKGYRIWAVGFALDPVAARNLLQVACCDPDCGGICSCNSCPHFANSDNAAELDKVYQDFANQIRALAKPTKSTAYQFESTNTFRSDLYPDSYIEYTYVPAPPPAGRSNLTAQVQVAMRNCTNAVHVPGLLALEEAHVFSFSSFSWTSSVVVNGQQLYDLDTYNLKFKHLGDPFEVDIPPARLQAGRNTIEVLLSHEQNKTKECSVNNQFLYKGRFAVGAVPDGQIAGGCHWRVAREDGGDLKVTIPRSYPGETLCEYTPAARTAPTNDRYAQAARMLLEALDINQDGRVDGTLLDAQLIEG